MMPRTPGFEKYPPISKCKVLFCLISMKDLKKAFSNLLATNHLFRDLYSLFTLGREH